VHGNAQQDNIKLYWYQNDHLGTPIALTGSLGDTLYECQYNAYGQIINETYHQDDIDSLPDNPLRFQGQYYDEETGLHYNLNRYYDPFTGRYITQDPLGILGGLNSYQYVNGDPINWIDPLGLIKVENNGFEGVVGKGNIIDNASEPLPLGDNLIDRNDSLAKAASWIKPKEGFFDVIIHGSSDSFSVFRNGKWIKLNQRSLTTFIQKNNYNGQPIRLISCNTGASPTSIAQDLSNKLGRKVIAPSDTIWIHPNGKMTIGKNPLSNTGKWNTFNPGENIK
jgi:RHS repeat-associated protein